MIIQHNLLAMNSNRQLGINTKNMKTTTEKLSSGYRINRAADDAAGLAMSEKMRRQIRGLDQSANNIQEGIGYVQTADGALNEAQDILQRMNELAVQSANGTNTDDDRAYIDGEIQQLKKELDRIFTDTSFNEKPIWVPSEGERVQIDSDYKQAVTIASTYTPIDITNKNCGVWSYEGYKMNATDTGVSVSWKGYDGKDYSTVEISWDKLKENNYSFELSDYFGAKDANNPLYVDGNPIFKHTISMSVEEDATLEQIKDSLNGLGMENKESVHMNGSFQEGNGNKAVSIVECSLNYGAAYASYTNCKNDVNNTDSGYDFDNPNEDFIKPSNKDDGSMDSQLDVGNMMNDPSPYKSLSDAEGNDKSWTFQFNMEGIGVVTATSVSVSYAAPNDQDANDEGDWWKWRTYGDGSKTKEWYENNLTGGTPANIVKAYEGNNGITTQGLKDVNQEGYIDLNFSLTSAKPFTSGGVSSTDVGSFALRVYVQPGETVESILTKINESLAKGTVVDLGRGTGSDGYIKSPTANNVQVEYPIWGGVKGFYVQGGTESGQHVGVDYDCLNLSFLGLRDTNTLTIEDSEKAINTIKNAIQIVSGQRSDLGAYQNRLEKARSVNENAEENTQASESVIRDTDMAKTMVSYSNLNILQQAGQAMLAQANQTKQGVMALLNQ